jgi:valyl-tRNA synthetase
MSQELPKAYDPSLIEEKWSRFWVDENIFSVPSPADASSITPFVQLLPPPNVTGRLHIGHMLEHTQMDIRTVCPATPPSGFPARITRASPRR